MEEISNMKNQLEDLNTKLFNPNTKVIEDKYVWNIKVYFQDNG